MVEPREMQPAGSRWLFLLVLIVLLAIMCLALFLLGPGGEKSPQGWVLPVSLHSLLWANYNADPLALQVPVFDLSVVEEALRDQGSGANLPARLVTLQEDMLTPVGTATPSSTPGGPIPTGRGQPSAALTSGPLPGAGTATFTVTLTHTLTLALIRTFTLTPFYSFTGTQIPTSASPPAQTLTLPVRTPTFTSTLTVTLPVRTPTPSFTPAPPTAIPTFTATTVFTPTRTNTFTQVPTSTFTPRPITETPPYPPPPYDTTTPGTAYP